jgi:DNA-binding NarL/FixJ family response regulator
VIRVLVVDDHPVVRSGLTGLLGSLEDIEVVGTAADGRTAVREAVLHRPDVVLLDLQMPDTDGFAALRELRRTVPDARVCVLTMFADDDSFIRALRAGAHGYLLKGAEQEEIERAVRGLAAGEVVFGPGVAAQALAQLSRPPAGVPFPALTARERDVLELMAAGMPPARIAARLQLAPKTVANHVSSILTKLAVPDRTQAALAARQAGLGTEGRPPS